jgi:hypothetical protein
MGFAGQLIRPRALQALQVLLRDRLKITVYKNHSEWVHPLYEAHVRPTLLDHYQSLRLNLEGSDR